MKLLNTTLAFVIMSAMAFAQSADKALARVRYTFSHMRDTTQRNDFYTENMLLVIGKNASVYTSYDKINRQVQMQKQIAEQIKNQAGDLKSINLQGGSFKPTTPNDYFYFANEDKLFSVEHLISTYLIEEPTPKFNWKITKDTTSFSGLKCQKATAHYKGRNWIAWFAPEMPFQTGPWKLSGLPGLIIEAHDEKNEVKFQFAGIEKVAETDATEEDQTTTLANGATAVVKIGGMETSNYLGNEIKLPTDAVKTSKKEFDKLKEARDKDPEGFMNAQLASKGITANVTRRININASGPAKKDTFNNPIELPEKK
jgi:GLPGLI family protein